MKLILAFAICLSTLNLFGQSSNSMGSDNNLMLNEQETEYLNTALHDSRESFDFKDKKIVFITGSAGSTVLSKQEFFLKYVKPYMDEGKTPQISLVPLLPAEKQLSNGYDAIVTIWVKFLSDKQKKRIIEQLSENTSSN